EAFRVPGVITDGYSVRHYAHRVRSPTLTPERLGATRHAYRGRSIRWTQSSHQSAASSPARSCCQPFGPCPKAYRLVISYADGPSGTMQLGRFVDGSRAAAESTRILSFSGG